MSQKASVTTNNPPTISVLNHWQLTKLSVIRLFYVSVGLVGLAFILLITALYTEYHHSRITTSAAQHGYTVGSSLSSGVTTTQLVSAHYETGQGIFKAPEGKEYAVIELKVTNRADKPINVLPTTDTYVKDAAGNTAYLTPYTLNAPFHSGELPAGESVQGQLSYMVPTTGSLKFYVDAIWSGGVLNYKLR